MSSIYKPQSVEDLTVTTAGGVKLEYFPDELIELRIEIDNHPELLAILAGQADKDVYVHIAEIAAYCRVMLAGDYTRDDIIEVCGKLVTELKRKREPLIYTTPIVPALPKS